MIYTPHEYQRYATKYLERHSMAALLLDMGLGKTVITLTALYNLLFDYFLITKVLVIAPLRVAENTWPQEIKKWDHLKGLRYSVVTGTEKERRAALKKAAYIYVINRENIPWLVENRLFSFDSIVIDELSSFKSWKSKRFKALMRVRPLAKHIIGLTGTPAGNGLMDLFAEYKILDMGKRLGRFITGYRKEYFLPDRINGSIIYSYRLRPGASQEIYEKISDITLSMKVGDYLEMPEVVFSEFTVDMNDDERKIYNGMCRNMVHEEVTAANAGVLSGKLLQMANGAVYSDSGKAVKIHDHKLDALEDIIESMNGRPLLVAYWYKHDLERIKKRFNVREINGDVDIETWNKGKIPIGLIHPASAGHGLNLQFGGSTLIWFGLTWSLELYKQTNARLWRQGQKKTVVIQHIVCKDTIDGYVLESLRRKNETQEALINAVKLSLEMN